jgi:GNAT superfamily N-acetyltransferase
MKIRDLKHDDLNLYYCCLEPWSDEMKLAVTKKEEWYSKMKDRGVKVKVAIDDDKEVAGMIQYTPANELFVDGENITFINCIWVHGHSQGLGNRQGKGMGQALLKAAENDAKSLGSIGIAAWGIPEKFWMSAIWYEKMGYKEVDRDGWTVLVWKPFKDNASAPKLIKKKKTPTTTPGKVNVTVFINGWCSSMNIVYEYVKKAIIEFGDIIDYHEFDTTNVNTLREWGLTDAVFIDGQEMFQGSPPSYEDVLKTIKEKVYTVI